MSSRPRSLAPYAFRRACSGFATGERGRHRQGQGWNAAWLTIRSNTLVSVAAPLILICIDSGCPFLSHFRLSTHFAVNVLSESRREIAMVFAEKPE
ncbi:MAG TPA: flavin reductase family protein [Bryobacteraceae bacterium]|nr:flavin reductase family protein [Bryobacteraceae bacterium]